MNLLRFFAADTCDDFLMTRLAINAPDSLELLPALQLCSDPRRLGQHDEYFINFSRTRTLTPFGMLLAAAELDRLRRSNNGAQISVGNYGHMGYGAHMGFFQAFGTSIGKAPGEALGSKNYLPITIFRTDALIRSAAISGREVGDEIESECKRMAETLIGQGEGDVFDAFAYSMREIMRNVIEHARADSVHICSQYWPTKGRAEVAILDCGIGLRDSIKSNPHIDASDDRKAIHYALMPAVSGKAFKGAPAQRGARQWKNSGFGLYMTSRLCRNGGNFFIASGEKGVLLTAGTGGKRVFDTSFSGTAIRMTIRTDQIANLKDALTKYREEGFEIQKKYQEIVSIDPSSASLMLSHDFNLSTWDRLRSRFKTS